MRILILSWEFPPESVGGLSQHVFELSRSLVNLGCQVEVVTAGNGNLPDNEKMDGVEVFRVIPYQGSEGLGFIDWVHRLNFALLEKAASLCRERGKYDLIHAHDWLVAFAARALKHIYTIPMLATIHATEYGRNSGIHNEQQRYISDIEWSLTFEAWKVICCSEYMRREVKNIFQIPDDKISIIPNGIRPDAYETQGVDLSQVLSPLPEKMVFYVGRMVQEKGIQVMLEAAPEILKRFPQAKFVIAGKGPFEQDLHRRTQEKGIQDSVIFLGFIDDATRNELYRAASAAVFPSLYEPFGIVALEAMICGAPVVVTSVGGFDEIVKHEVDGLKAAPADPHSLTEQISRLLEGGNFAASLAENAYQKARRQYSWDNIAEQTSKIYEEIIFSPKNTQWQQKSVHIGQSRDEVEVERRKKDPQIPDLV